jgi:hypothetical protein
MGCVDFAAERSRDMSNPIGSGIPALATARFWPQAANTSSLYVAGGLRVGAVWREPPEVHPDNSRATAANDPTTKHRSDKPTSH